MDLTQIILQSIRIKRNTLLKECDWTILPDAPTNKEAWQIYRQQLRDITEGLDVSTITRWDDEVALEFFPPKPA